MGNLLFATVAALTLGQAADTSPHSDLSLRLVGVEPGKSFTVAATISLESEWHCYWINPGDSGMATSFSIQLPPGFKAGPVRWATPHRLVSQGLTAFGYEKEAVALIEISMSKEMIKFPSRLVVEGNWLVCQEACVPARQQATLDLQAGDLAKGVPVPAPIAGQFPIPDHGKVVRSAGKTADGFRLSVAATTGIEDGSFQFYPEVPGVTDHGEPMATKTANGWELTLKNSPYASKAPRILAGVLTFRVAGKVRAYKIYQRIS